MECEALGAQRREFLSQYGAFRKLSKKVLHWRASVENDLGLLRLGNNKMFQLGWGKHLKLNGS